MGAAAAAENPTDTDNATMKTTDDATPVVSENTGGAESLLGVSNDGNNFLGNARSNSFMDLDILVNDTKGYEKTIYLDRDYFFDNESDTEYNNTGIYLGTFTTIDGQGHTIDAKNTRMIFNIIGTNVILKNINFKNSNYRAIEVGSDDVSIIGCTFDNCTNRAIGISSSGTNCVIDSCNFTDGSGGVYTGAAATIIKNSNFIDNVAGSGGALNVQSNNVVVDNCKFKNNNATSGGAIYFQYDPTLGILTIKDSTFVNNLATSGGAIYTQNAIWYNNQWVSKGNKVNIVSSVFTGNTAVNNPVFGGSELDSEYGTTYTIDSETTNDNGKYVDDIDSKFENVHGGTVTLDANGQYTMHKGSIIVYVDEDLTIDGNGATIDANGNRPFQFIIYSGTGMHTVTFKNIIIKNAHADSSGGAIHVQGFHTGLKILDSKFYNNSASSDGGAIFLSTESKSKGNTGIWIENSEFINNTAEGYGGAIRGDARTFINYIKYSNFTNNTASNGGALSIGGNNQVIGEFTYNHFINNTASNNGVIYTIVSGGINSNYNTYDGNVAISDAIGNVNFGENDIIGVNRQSSLAEQLSNIVDNHIDITKDNYNFDASFTINTPNIIIDFNNSTINGFGNTILTIAANNVTIKNLNLINGTIHGNTKMMYFVHNSTFTDCNVALEFNNVGLVENVNFTNCNKTISSTYWPVKYTNINIDGKIINDLLFDQLYTYDFNKLSFTRCQGTKSNPKVVTLEPITYDILSPIMIGDYVTFDGNGAVFNMMENNPLIYASAATSVKNFEIHNNPTATYSIYCANDLTVDNVKFINASGVQTVTSLADRETLTLRNCVFEEIDTNEHLIKGYNVNISNLQVSNINSTKNIVNAYVLTMDEGVFNNIQSTSSVSYSQNLIVENSRFEDISVSGNGGALYVVLNGNVSGCDFINNKALSGGAIYQNVESGVLNVSNSTFDGGKAIASGGAILCKGTLILDDCDFNNNIADSAGAVSSVGSLNITNSNFNNNSAVLGAGLYSVADNANISGSTFSNNTADVGAGVYTNGNNIKVTGSNFTDNNATVLGSSIVSDGDGATLDNITVTGNRAPSGSAIVLNGNNANLTGDSVIKNNVATDGDGSVIMIKGNNSEVSNVNITNNTGIGMSIEGTDVTVKDNNITGNSVSGINVIGNGTEITNNTFGSEKDIMINPGSDLLDDEETIQEIINTNFPQGEVNILMEVVPVIIAYNVTVKENTLFNITVTNKQYGGNVSVKVNGTVVYNGTVSDIAEVNVTGPVLIEAGVKTAEFVFYGDELFNNKTLIKEFNVIRVNPVVNVTVSTVVYGNNSLVKINISDFANGTVVVSYNNTDVVGNVKNGVADVDLGILPAGENKEVTVEFFYGDNDKFNNNMINSTTFNVNKAESNITISVDSVYYVDEDIIITVKPTVPTTGNLTVKINDGNYSINASGVISISGLPAGDYTITASLTSDENYTDCTITKTFIIKKINTDLIHLKNTKNK